MPCSGALGGGSGNRLCGSQGEQPARPPVLFDHAESKARGHCVPGGQNVCRFVSQILPPKPSCPIVDGGMRVNFSSGWVRPQP